MNYEEWSENEHLPIILRTTKLPLTLSLDICSSIMYNFTFYRGS